MNIWKWKPMSALAVQNIILSFFCFLKKNHMYGYFLGDSYILKKKYQLAAIIDNQDNNLSKTVSVHKGTIPN